MGEPGREWIRITGWGGRSPGWIPRDVAEGLGVSCSPLDHFWWTPHGGKTQGTVWFTREQSEALRAHSEFELEPVA